MNAMLNLSLIRALRTAFGYGIGLFQYGYTGGVHTKQLIYRSLGGSSSSTNLNSIPKVSNGSGNLLQSADVFIFDCDGVLWKGETIIEGAAQVLDKLREQKKTIYFVTNNSTKSRQGYISKFASLGIHVNPEGI
jgi:hypothetical protein